ncbi:DUF2955 domain-containing protein [Desulfogranum marinum]|uniref:DUF2955 domain-containing protein n=1 Tax=Desulfogranum marinum TaxID=453220 RepID=UPI0029C669A7|nr:DUF2955 domain-containing protein [Desulfogranum marinum]
MNVTTVKIVRMTAGLTAAVAVSYGIAWPLSFVTPIFAAIFLLFPVWIGWEMAVQLIGRLVFSLFIGLIISEYLLVFPLLCILILGILLFYIYYNDTPAAPPMATLFMTIGVIMVPIMGLSGAQLSHMIAIGLLFNMTCGLFFAWLFHRLIPDSLAAQKAGGPAAAKPPPPPETTPEERARLALTSTLVALSAVAFFFSFNLAQYALAMLYICLMAGTPSTVASFQVMKANSLATCIGGAAMIVAFNLLVAVPTYMFLLLVVCLFAYLFSVKIFTGGAHAAAFTSGLTTFLVLLGSSTGVDKEASINFYLRIAQVLFAGLFTIVALRVVDHILRPKRKRIKT